MAFKKAVVLFCCTFLGAISPVFGITLEWDPGDSSPGVFQYKLYEHLPSGYALVAVVIPPQTTYDLPPLSPGVHAFAVTAVSAAMESPPSNEMTVSSFASSLDFASSNALTITSASNLKRSGAPYPSQITVSGITQPISNMRVALHGVTHLVASQVDVLLVGPQGQKVMLMSDTGGKNPISSANLVFSDRADQSLSANPIQSGTYKPTNLNPSGQLDEFPLPAPPRPYSKTLSVFNSTDANGTWQLFVLNDGLTGTGTIAGWTLKFDLPGAPIVAAFPAVGITSTTANLTGTINPMGKASIWAFYFGPTDNYNSAQSGQDAGSGVIPVSVSLALNGLKPGTTYHYQLVGQNSSGICTTDDLTFITSPLVDSDGDGMPDDYELVNHLNPNSASDANRDSDGDGMSNLQEYLAGTNPNNNRSVLRITVVQKTAAATITFPTVTGKQYQVQRATDLAQRDWAVLYNDVSGTGQLITLEDYSAAELPIAFYRVVVIP